MEICFYVGSNSNFFRRQLSGSFVLCRQQSLASKVTEAWLHSQRLPRRLLLMLQWASAPLGSACNPPIIVISAKPSYLQSYDRLDVNTIQFKWSQSRLSCHGSGLKQVESYNSCQMRFKPTCSIGTMS